MNGKEIYTDDGLMRAAGAILADERLAAFEGRMDEEHRFSPRSERRLRKILNKTERQAASDLRGRANTGRRWSVRGAAVVAALVFLSVAAIAAGPVIGMIRTRTTIEKLKNGTYQVTVEQGDDAEAVTVGGEPTYLPEGYEELWREGEEGSHVFYARPKVNSSVIDFEWMTWEEGTVRFNGEDARGIKRTEPVQVGPYEGVLLYYDEPGVNVGGKAAVVWWDSARMYRVSAYITDPPDPSTYVEPTAPLPVEELLKVAESVTAAP
jgi:hypothetical protein